MTDALAKPVVPYRAQWESPGMIRAFLAGGDAVQDPLWHRSGAETAQEYARWAEHLCGVACLRMVLAARGVEVSAFDVMRALRHRGGYVEAKNGSIQGLIYAPAVEWLATAHGIEARIILDLEAAAIPALLDEGLFIASVHPAIRAPEAASPGRGGHLVLVHGVTAHGELVLHNPSGDCAGNQVDAQVAIADFRRFFAGRGILVTHPARLGCLSPA
ncbi:MAG: hypothetical protein JWO26_2285 [Rhodospirillales bacterium]|jgi:hypothetical protein|nr:hypothetical protein [Rhodospirillales bacterium]